MEQQAESGGSEPRLRRNSAGTDYWLVEFSEAASATSDNSGNDYLIGTDGDDNLDAGAGIDVFRGSLGNDILDGGGDEYDQIDYAGSSDDYIFVAKDGGYEVTKSNGDVDMLFDIDGVWFAGSDEWNYIADMVDTDEAAA